MNIADHEAADHEIEAIKDRISESAWRCLRIQVIRLTREWERCGKAACARTRSCRGFACQPRRYDDNCP